MLGGHPTVQVPPWPVMDEHTAAISPFSLPVSGVTSFGGGGEDMKLAALLRFLLPAQSGSDEPADPPVDVYSCDEFRMFEFKVRRCARGRSHDWTDCPFAHPGEKARRRDPRKFLYIGTSCPDFRNGGCKKGDACEFAHGVFESWLHPDRYRTQPCKDGTDCQRRICFFAHTPEQLRAVPVTQQPSPKSAAASPKLADSYDGSPLRRRASLEAAYFSKALMSSSPTSTLAPLSDSPPVSPMGARRGAVPVCGGMNEVLAVMKRMRMMKVEPAPQNSWELGLGSPRRVNSGLRETPSSAGRGYGANLLGYNLDEGESPEGIVAASGLPDLDVGWVSELVK